MSQPSLSTPRIELVPLADEHLDLEVELDSDPEVLRFLFPRARTRAEVEQLHVRRLAAAREVDGLGFWAGFVAGEFVGWWILQPPNGPDQPKVPGEAELGYRLLRRWWRHGLAAEASRELLRYGFDDLGLTRIFAQTLATNEGSRAVMAAVGMSYVRGFPSATDDPLPGIELGEVEYAITRAEWSAAGRRDWWIGTDLAAVDWSVAKQLLAADRFDNGRSPAALRACFQNSAHVVAAWSSTGLCGLARMLSDGVCNAYLVDVWTRSSMRRRGIATAMVERLARAVPGQHIGLQTEDAAAFYEALGFRSQPEFFSRVVGRWLDNEANR